MSSNIVRLRAGERRYTVRVCRATTVYSFASLEIEADNPAAAKAQAAALLIQRAIDWSDAGEPLEQAQVIDVAQILPTDPTESAGV